MKINAFPPGVHAGILLVRTTHPSITVVTTILTRVPAEHRLDDLFGCLVVADETRTRVRR